MNIQSRPQLETQTGQAIPLVGMDIKAKIEGLLTSICVEQTYHNTEKVNIEAVYTFPLPMAAVLTKLQVKIADRLLSAKILEKAEAEARYEEAITDGASVVMLQKLESGLYSMNIGNLQADEKISVQMEYAFVQSWQSNQLRLMLPTTVAPRYGNDPFAPHQMPETTIFVEHKYQLEVTISGALAKAKVSSPSHRLVTQGQGDLLSISLQDKAALMDKDFVLLIESEEDHNLGLVSKDKKGYCALASFHPQFTSDLPTESKNFKIVVDCSGSMGGGSIEQARLALERIVSSLDAGDFFNIIKFGSSYESLFNTMVPATQANIQYALKEISRIDANLGGTEIDSALQAAYQLSAESKQADEILLITDGEVWNTDPIIQNAVKSKHRIFTVGVGVAVSESFVRGLAEQTGGACELVTPNEDMAEKIVRHFSRMRTPAAKSVRVEWSDSPQLQLDVGAVYSGDTLNVWAWFDKQPVDQVNLQLEMGDGQVIKQSLKLTAVENYESLHPLARLAAAKRMESLQEKNEIVAIACDYQLMSIHTNYLMVDEEGEKAEELPELRKVPHMMPDMWLSAAPADVVLCRSLTAKPAALDMLSAEPACMDYLSETAEDKSNSLINKIEQTDLENIKVEDLHNFDCDHLDLLIQLQQQGFDSHEIAITYLYYRLQSQDGKNLQERSLRKLVKHFKQLSIGSELTQAVKKILNKLPSLPVFL
jgi:Ca-activated chloride channel family protein